MDFEIETISYKFIGREEILTTLQEAWKCGKYRIFGLFGTRSVGKSRTVKVILSKIADSQSKQTTIDMRHVKSVQQLHVQMCARLEILPTPHWGYGENCLFENVYEEINRDQSLAHLFHFDNIEDAVEEDTQFLSICVNLVRHCKNVRIFLTSTTEAQFAQIRPVYFSVKLLPMSVEESVQLLQEVASTASFDGHLEEIGRLCCGLPLALIIAGSKIETGIFKPWEIVELLIDSRLQALNNDGAPGEDAVGDLYQRFLRRLSKEFQIRLVYLEYIPGTFNIEQAREMLDEGTVAVTKHRAMIPLFNRSMLMYDPGNQRFDIHGILRDCLEIHEAIKSLHPQMHTRYCRIFTEEMVKISRKIPTKEYLDALSSFTLEYPNLQKLFTEVRYTNEDTYPFFIRVADKCQNMIEKFMSDTSEEFYQQCLAYSKKLDQNMDQAIVLVAIGSLRTNAKGDFKSGQTSYEKAEKLIINGPPSTRLAVIYQKQGWNLLCQGRAEEALRVLENALNLFTRLDLGLTDSCLSAFTVMGLALNHVGSFQEAKKYMKETLKRRLKKVGENHPSIGSTYNNMGLLYENMGDYQKALECHSKGLEIKQRTKAPPSAILISQNNVAMQYSRVGLKDKAEEMLEEALQTMREQSKPNKGNLSLTLDTLGKIYLAKKKCHEAERVLKEAVVIREEIMPTGAAYVESLMHLVRAQMMLEKDKAAIATAEKVLLLQDSAKREMPHNTFILECLECLRDIHKRTDCEQLPCVYRNMETEIQRLQLVFEERCNKNKVLEMRQRLKLLKFEFNALT